MPAGISSAQSPPWPRPDPARATHTDCHLTGKRVVVMGLGRFGGGIGAARWLAGQNARVLVTDLADRAVLGDSIAQLADLDIDYRLGGHCPDILDHADLVVVSPAVPKKSSPFFREVLRRGIPWTTEINLFLERCPAKVVGVTGSAGKSTTATMIQACLSAGEPQGSPPLDRRGTGPWNRSATPKRDGAPPESPHRVYLGGNIGRSLLRDVHQISPDDIVVLELSSFQLADLPLITRRPDMAVIVSVWPQHLDRHGSFESYLDCKLNMIRGTGRGTPVVIGFDDPALLSKVEAAGRDSAIRIVRASDTPLSARLRVPGAHNELNARCAMTVCGLLGVDQAVVCRALESFAGLPHRLQFVGRYAGIDYYNDSKATSPRTVVTALRSFDRPVIALIGGRSNRIAFDELMSAAIDSCRAVVCFGSGGRVVYSALCDAAGYHPRIDLHCVDGLGDAVPLAAKLASSGDVVLLSPGFDSYDEFTNYEQRGDTFVSLVQAIASEHD